MCEHCNGNEDLRDVKGFDKIYKELGDKPYEDLSGQVFNKLRAIKPVGRNKHGSVLWLCECECFSKRIVCGHDLVKNRVKSCGSTKCISLFTNLEGKVFTRWTVLKDEGGDKVFCKCFCGTERWVSRGNLRTGGSTSCGCLQKEVLHEKYRKVEVGQIYGRLTIRKCLGRNHNKKLIWEAECSCGNIVTVTSDLIRNGHTRSCGCLKKEQTKERCTKPMVGKTFGRLTVLRLHHNEKGHNFYECLCSCGNTSIVDGTWLRSWNTTSCGCYAREKSHEYEDLSGRRFGELVVLRRVPNRGRGHGTRFLCKCDCGGLTETARHSLLCGETVSCGCINSKGELKISQILNENNIIFERQKTYDDLRIGKHGIPKFDFYVPEGNYIIEYDGQQHFIYTNLGWNDKEHFKKVQERDKLKNEYCKRNNIPIIRIPYTQYDTICIEDLLLETSKFILKE